jgi:hypothetical protein
MRRFVGRAGRKETLVAQGQEGGEFGNSGHNLVLRRVIELQAL